MPIIDFARGGSATNQPSSSSTTKPRGGVIDFARGSTTAAQQPAHTPVPKEDKGFFRFLMKQLGKPLGATAAQTRGISEFAAQMAIGRPQAASQAIKTNFDKALDIYAGKAESSFSAELRDARGQAEETIVDKILLGSTDFVLDPLYVTKPVKVAKVAGKLTKLDKPAAKVANIIAKSKPFKTARGIVSNRTGDIAFDKAVINFRALAGFRKGKALEDAVKLQKIIKKIGGGKTDDIIVNALEDTSLISKITDEKTLNVVKGLQKTYKTFLEEARSVGLKIDEVVEFAPRVRTKQSFLGKLKGGKDTREISKGAIEKGRSINKFTPVADDAPTMILKNNKGLKRVGAKEAEAKGLSPAFEFFKDKGGRVYEKGSATQDEIRKIGGFDIFERSPAVQFAVKGQAYAKAITAKEFANTVKKFAIKEGVPVTNPMLKGLKFTDEQAKVIDNFYRSIQPEELKLIARAFDSVQGVWKAQALVGPSYHIRNFAGNIWNNFLAGVNVGDYAVAAKLQNEALRTGKAGKEILSAKRWGVLQTGQFEADIARAVKGKVKGGFRRGINPFSQEFYGYKINRAIGGGIEDNAKLAHFITMQKKGMTAEDAALSVKKYLFDYGDLTKVEQSVFKRVLPFYTWTRKNLPLQISELVRQPGKFTVPGKVINAIESAPGNEPPDEKFLSPYIKENVPVRIRKNADGNSEYFMLGQWLPYASAIDVLSQPMDTILSMITPIAKAPLETWFNKSSYFKNTLGEFTPIETTHKQQGEFLGQSMRKKTISLLRNIRILNEMNKFVDKKDPRSTEQSMQNKILNLLVGKAATFDENKSRFFFERDTDVRIRELITSIRDASEAKDTKQVEKLRDELKRFRRERR